MVKPWKMTFFADSRRILRECKRIGEDIRDAINEKKLPAWELERIRIHLEDMEWDGERRFVTLTYLIHRDDRAHA